MANDSPELLLGPLYATIAWLPAQVSRTSLSPCVVIGQLQFWAVGVGFVLVGVGVGTLLCVGGVITTGIVFDGEGKAFGDILALGDVCADFEMLVEGETVWETLGLADSLCRLDADAGTGAVGASADCVWAGLFNCAPIARPAPASVSPASNNPAAFTGLEKSGGTSWYSLVSGSFMRLHTSGGKMLFVVVRVPSSGYPGTGPVSGMIGRVRVVSVGSSGDIPENECSNDIAALVN